jgi:hypothetical protein
MCSSSRCMVQCPHGGCRLDCSGGTLATCDGGVQVCGQNCP